MLVKEPQVVENSRALHYGMPHNYIIVLARKTLEIIIIIRGLHSVVRRVADLVIDPRSFSANGALMLCARLTDHGR